jgi:cyclopropane fatty-acyl-phospholipid synthase-like methyltransferase
MTKRLEEYGVCTSAKIVAEAEKAKVSVTKVARGYTYTTKDDKLPPTPLAFEGNPFNDEIRAAKNILDFGCGIGRNLPWIFENTDAIYYGLDPNPVMLENFWKVQDPEQINVQGVFLLKSFEDIPKNMVFDVVVSTFVFQHLGYRATEGVMDVNDMTQEIMKHTRPGTIWFLHEHEAEEQGWLDRWFTDNGIEPDFFELNWTGMPELTHRGHDAHLVLWRQT